jgi:thymidylate synthase (FAD)
MKIVDQSYTIWGPAPIDNRDDAILYLEKGGRICYRSEDKIVPGSGEKFITNCFNRNHSSVLEMSNIVFRTSHKVKFPQKILEYMKCEFDSKYFNFGVAHDYVYIGGSWRTWIEYYDDKGMDIEDVPFNMPISNDNDFVQVTDINELPPEILRIGVCFCTDRAVTHEMVRHRPCSFLQESQRYVRYMDELIFIKPWWYNNEKSNVLRFEFDKAMEQAEDHYRYMIRHLGAKAEEARAVLPNATATKILIMADIPEWMHIFNLRTSKAAYAQYRNLMIDLKADFIDKGWIV